MRAELAPFGDAKHPPDQSIGRRPAKRAAEERLGTKGWARIGALHPTADGSSANAISRPHSYQ